MNEKKINKSEDISKLIEDNTNFEKIKAYPKNRWFNSFVAIILTVIGIMLGIIIGCLLIIFL